MTQLHNNTLLLKGSLNALLDIHKNKPLCKFCVNVISHIHTVNKCGKVVEMRYAVSTI